MSKSRLGYWKAPVQRAPPSPGWMRQNGEINSDKEKTSQLNKRKHEPSEHEESFVMILKDYCLDHGYGSPEFVVMQTVDGYCCSLNYWAGIASVSVPQVTPGGAKEVAAAKALQQLGVESLYNDEDIASRPSVPKKKVAQYLSPPKSIATTDPPRKVSIKTFFSHNAQADKTNKDEMSDELYSCHYCPSAGQIYDKYSIRIHMLSNHADIPVKFSRSATDENDNSLNEKPLQGESISSSIDAKKHDNDSNLCSDFFAVKSIDQRSVASDTHSTSNKLKELKPLSKSDKSYLSNAFKLNAIVVDWENTFNPFEGIYYCNSCEEKDYTVGYKGEERIIDHIRSKHSDLSYLCSKGGSRLEKSVSFSYKQPLKVGEEITCYYCYVLEDKKKYLDSKRSYFEHVRTRHSEIFQGDNGITKFPLISDDGRLLVKSVFQCPYCDVGKTTLSKGIKEFRYHVYKKHSKVTIQSDYIKHYKKEKNTSHSFKSPEDIKEGFFGN